MTHPCPQCTETPCECGAQGYIVLALSDLEMQVAPVRRLIMAEGGELEQYMHQLGEWVMEIIMGQENLDV